MRIRQGCLVQTNALWAGLGRKWPGIFFAPLPRARRAQHWGPANMGTACPKQGTPFSPYALQPESLFHGSLAPSGWAPVQVPAPPPHTGLFAGACRGRRVVLLWLPGAPRRCQSGSYCIQSPPKPPSGLQREEGACVPGAAGWSPAHGPGPSWSQLREQSRFCLFVHHGEL